LFGFCNFQEAGNIEEQSNASLKKHGIQSKAWGGTFGTLQYSQNLIIGRQLARIGSLILAAFVLGWCLRYNLCEKENGPLMQSRLT
jgi:hypothetical protein